MMKPIANSHFKLPATCLASALLLGVVAEAQITYDTTNRVWISGQQECAAMTPFLPQDLFINDFTKSAFPQVTGFSEMATDSGVAQSQGGIIHLIPKDGGGTILCSANGMSKVEGGQAFTATGDNSKIVVTGMKDFTHEQNGSSAAGDDQFGFLGRFASTQNDVRPWPSGWTTIKVPFLLTQPVYTLTITDFFMRPDRGKGRDGQQRHHRSNLPSRLGVD